MLFNSYEFIFLFLPISLTLYFFFAQYRLTKISTAWLVIASLVFYSYWDVRYLFLLLASILFNYLVGYFLENNRNKRLLSFGILFNLCLLGYYKYMAFFLESFNQLNGSVITVPNIILPLGISFFTFTQTAYLVDVYRGETKNYSLLTYCLFVTVFPHLIAGPILYHKDMIPQFSEIKNFVFSPKNMYLGVSLFSIGLFKKVILADTLAPWVNVIFENTDKVGTIEAWLGAIAYTLQLYFDFSGYSEMAMGLGLMFNFKLPLNFNSPYHAVSIIDFWRRWHITLSTYLKNYLYIPLGGNKKGELRRVFNLLVTMLLGGLWHGAGWNFIVWGGLHGSYLVINHTWRRTQLKLPMFISWLITFICVVLAWVFFRASSIDAAINLIKSMLKFHLDYQYFHLNFINKTACITIVGMCLILALPNVHYLLNKYNYNFKWAFLIAIIFIISILNLGKETEFLYFQF